MAFYFIGGGILELQSAGWIHASPIAGCPQISWLGIFPTWQNISVQGVFLLLSLGAYAIWRVRNIRVLK
jgi:high-affinity iron transporter